MHAPHSWRDSVAPLATLVGLLTALLWLADARERPRRPDHLVLIVFDTMRADRMSIYGHDAPTTPFLESIRGDLLKFDNAKAPAPWTVPSHASLMTGLWPSEHRAQWGNMTLDDRFVTLAEVLRGRGFCTIGLTANPLASDRTGIAQGFDHFERVESAWTRRSADLLARLDRELGRAAMDGCRLFLFVNVMDAHMPFNPHRFAEAFDVPRRLPVPDTETKWRINAGRLSMSERQIRHHRAAYDASVRYVDEVARRIFRTLGDHGFLDESLVVMTSDHGEGLGYQRELGHSLSVWEEQLAVPLLMRFPDGRRGGETVARPTSLTGLAPTLLDRLGVPRPAPMRDLAGLEANTNRPASADYRSFFVETSRHINRSVAERYPDLAARTRHSHILYCGSHKLVVDAGGGVRFHDLADDPDEQEDLAETAPPSLPPCLDEYFELLAAGRFTPFDERSEEVDELPIDEETLRSLGYMD